MATLVGTLTSSTTSVTFTPRNSHTDAPRVYTLILGGTFDGATVTVSASPDGSTFYNIPFASYAASSSTPVNITISTDYVKFTQSGGGASCSIPVYIF